MTQVAKLFHPLIRRAAYLLYQVWGGFEVRGVENIPAQGAVLLAVNHISLADPLSILAASPRRLYYMAARELHELWWLDPIIRFLGSFPVDRNTMDLSAIAKARSLLRQGEGVVIWPEGKVSPDGTLQPLQPGVAVLALREQVPIIPVVVQGTDGMFPLGAKFPRYHFNSVTFGVPLKVRPLRKGESVKVRVHEALGQLRDVLLQMGAPAPSSGPTYLPQGKG